MKHLIAVIEIVILVALLMALPKIMWNFISALEDNIEIWEEERKIEKRKNKEKQLMPDSVLLKPCRLCGGSPNVDYFKPQGYMAYCPGCHFVMNSREETIEKAVEIWNSNN